MSSAASSSMSWFSFEMQRALSEGDEIRGNVDLRKEMKEENQAFQDRISNLEKKMVTRFRELW